MNGPFSGILDDDRKVSQSSEWVASVLVIVTDLFQN